MMDSMSALKIAKQQAKTQFRQHIEVRCHHLVHHTRAKSIILKHFSSHSNQGDVRTKPIAPA